MNYRDPRLRAILAGEYVLGTLPARARARFERLLRFDADLARLAGEWAERFAAIDEAEAIAPPARVWRAIEARTRPARAPGIRFALPIPRLALLAAATILLALALNLAGVGLLPPPSPHVVAVLADRDGQPAWLVTEDRSRTRLAVEAVRAQPIDSAHAFELWAIADAKPVPMGLIAASLHARESFPASVLPKNGALLAVSLEPPGGSPTGLPTGPVLYKGAVLSD